METVRHVIPVTDLDEPSNLNKLRYAFFAPAELRPDRSVDTVTKETADLFQANCGRHGAATTRTPKRLARYLNQIVFCLYAEDAGLLPGRALHSGGAGPFSRSRKYSTRLISNLFTQMAGGGMFGATPVAHFNGDLFINAETIKLSEAALQRLGVAAQKNWSDIEPSIFGTLFERALDASKRSHLGAHYTGAEDIMLVVEPVIMAPLRAEWEGVQLEVGNLLIEGEADAARVRLAAFQQRLFEVEVLDPACGSGNFLYLALRSLLDLEKQVIDFAATHGWHNLLPTIKPDQMPGLEINPYAAELARTALWIGYIQWHQNNGFPYTHSPILTPLVSIRKTDAILAEGDTGNPREPEWPAAEFIIGNPPFLGGKLLRLQLGDEYVAALFGLYKGRVSAEADLVCYWFEKARTMLGRGTGRAGGLAGHSRHTRRGQSPGAPTDQGNRGHLPGLVRPSLDSGRRGSAHLHRGLRRRQRGKPRAGRRGSCVYQRQSHRGGRPDRGCAAQGQSWGSLHGRHQGRAVRHSWLTGSRDAQQPESAQ